MKRDAKKTSWRLIILKEKCAEHYWFNACIAGSQLAEDQLDFSITLVDEEIWEHFGQFTSNSAEVSRIDRATNPNHWHNFEDDETPRRSPDIGPPKQGLELKKLNKKKEKLKQIWSKPATLI